MKTFELSKEIIQEISQLISSKKNKEIKKIVDGIHYADLAEIINELDFDQRLYLIKLIDSDKTSDVLKEVDEDVREKISSITDDWKNIDVLINNAGNAHGLDFIYEGEIEDWDMMIDTNVKGLPVSYTHLTLPTICSV